MGRSWMSIAAITAALTVVSVFPAQTASQAHPYQFEVREAATATKIAKVAFEQEFGRQELNRLRWFEATLEGDHWKVYGHPYKRGRGPRTTGDSWDFIIAVRGGTVLSISAEM